MGSNPVEVPNFWGGVNFQLVDYNYHCDDHIFIKMSFSSNKRPILLIGRDI